MLAAVGLRKRIILEASPLCPFSGTLAVAAPLLLGSSCRFCVA
jgi:hypothetical protein